MAAEESGPYATLAAPFPELREPLARLRADHGTLREMTRDLADLLAAPADARRDERLLVLISDLAELLRLHFRAEERLAFEWRTRFEPARGPGAELQPPTASRRGRANR
jgi:hemerythrin-like domain-containing protein